MAELLRSYKELRDKAFNATPQGLSFEILVSNFHLVYHPPVNQLGKSGHYTIYQDNSAVCCPANEAMLLYQITEHLQPKTFIEVGSYAGWSSMHILEALPPTSYFFAVDDFSECTKPDLVKIVLADQLCKYSNSFIYEIDSTDFLNDRLGYAQIIFIDGFHRDGKPLQDVKASLNCLDVNGYIILHDTWMPDVKVASEWLIEQGFNCHTFETDNYLSVYSKGELEWLKTLVY